MACACRHLCESTVNRNSVRLDASGGILQLSEIKCYPGPAGVLDVPKVVDSWCIKYLR